MCQELLSITVGNVCSNVTEKIYLFLNVSFSNNIMNIALVSCLLYFNTDSSCLIKGTSS